MKRKFTLPKPKAKAKSKPKGQHPAPILSGGLVYALKAGETWSTELPGFTAQEDGRIKRVRPQRQGDRPVLQATFFVRNQCRACGKPCLTQCGTEHPLGNPCSRGCAKAKRSNLHGGQHDKPQLLSIVDGWVRSRLSTAAQISE